MMEEHKDYGGVVVSHLHMCGITTGKDEKEIPDMSLS